MATETKLTWNLRRLLVKKARLEAELRVWLTLSETFPYVMSDLAGRIAAVDKKINLYPRRTVLID